jgi:hypothetical protein
LEERFYFWCLNRRIFSVADFTEYQHGLDYNLENRTFAGLLPTPLTAAGKKQIAVIAGPLDSKIFNRYAERIDILLYDSIASLEYPIVMLYMPLLPTHFLDATRAICHLITVTDRHNFQFVFGRPATLPFQVQQAANEQSTDDRIPASCLCFL